ncbi:uncharacterized protein isoform X1 [Macaca fascicularis]|uniref:uncharacterized protein isoform X1 n=1 Tax=Macaca fascicularis TaxID=9541 RepID=UPI003D1576FB
METTDSLGVAPSPFFPPNNNPTPHFSTPEELELQRLRGKPPVLAAEAAAAASAAPRAVPRRTQMPREADSPAARRSSQAAAAAAAAAAAVVAAVALGRSPRNFLSPPPPTPLLLLLQNAPPPSFLLEQCNWGSRRPARASPGESSRRRWSRAGGCRAGVGGAVLEVGAGGFLTSWVLCTGRGATGKCWGLVSRCMQIGARNFSMCMERFPRARLAFFSPGLLI